MIKIYNDAYYAFKDLADKKKELSEQDRERIIKYVFTSSVHCAQFLEQKLYSDELEKERAFKKVLMSCDASANLLVSSYKSQLTKAQSDLLIEVALEHWSSAFAVFKAGLLDEKQKKLAFDIITLNQYTLMDFLKSGLATLEQRMFLLNESNLNDVGDCIIRHYKLYPNQSNDDRPDRKQAMDKQFQHSYRIYEYAKKNLLTKEELTLAYQKWNKHWFDEFKYQFESYYEYCKVFQEHLNEHELKIFFGKFNKRGNNTHKLKDACKDFYVPELKIKLEALAVAYTLKKAATRR